MIELRIGNSYSQLLGLTVAQHKIMQGVLFYMPDPSTSRFSGNYYKKYLIDKKGNFPSGLLKLVKETLRANRIEYTAVDSRRVPRAKERLFNLNLPFPPYDEQKAIGRLPETVGERGTISACTGFGKSVAIMCLIQKLQLKTLVIVPNLTLKHQLTLSFEQYFGKTPNIRVENIDSRALAKLTGYDVLIIDECHHAAAKTYLNLNKKAWDGIFYKYAFTATPWRTQSEEQILLESVAGQVIYEVTYQQAVNQDIIVPIESYFVSIPPTKTQSGQTWSQFYSQCVTHNEPRNHIIANLLGKFHDAGVSTLCLVKEIKHGQRLSDLSGAPFANGINEETPDLIKWFSQGKLKTLVATSGIAGEGCDTRAAEYIIIAGLGKSRTQIMQQVGRGVRKFGNKDSCKVILISDRSHKWSKAHFREQIKILAEEYNISAVELRI